MQTCENFSWWGLWLLPIADASMDRTKGFLLVNFQDALVYFIVVQHQTPQGMDIFIQGLPVSSVGPKAAAVNVRAIKTTSPPFMRKP